jgi:hypothetical protein
MPILLLNRQTCSEPRQLDSATAEAVLVGFAFITTAYQLVVEKSSPVLSAQSRQSALSGPSLQLSEICHTRALSPLHAVSLNGSSKVASSLVPLCSIFVRPAERSLRADRPQRTAAILNAGLGLHKVKSTTWPPRGGLPLLARLCLQHRRQQQDRPRLPSRHTWSACTTRSHRAECRTTNVIHPLAARTALPHRALSPNPSSVPGQQLTPCVLVLLRAKPGRHRRWLESAASVHGCKLTNIDSGIPGAIIRSRGSTVQKFVLHWG